ncbi:Aasdh [Symbiodinium sp. CCMP2456]|nr:Aasdh [Symbiodinium sp. CCMP2456]
MWTLFERRCTEQCHPALLDHELPASHRAKSYAEVLHQVKRLSPVLESVQSVCGPSERSLAVCFERTCFAAVVSLLTALHVRCPYVPLSTNCPGVGRPIQRIAVLLKMASVCCILCGSNLAGLSRSAWEAFRGSDTDQRVIDVEAFVEQHGPAVAGVPGAAKAATPDSQDTIHIIFTSGSTGRPKGVLGLHAATLNRLHWQWTRFPWKDGEVACARTPLVFIDHVAEIFGSLLAARGPVLVCPLSTTHSAGLLTSVHEFAVTRIVLTPTLLGILLVEATNLEKSPWRSLRMLTCSGELLTRSLVAQARVQIPEECKLLNIYGSTEMAGDATCAELPFDDVSDHTALLVPCGRAIDGVNVLLRQETVSDDILNSWDDVRIGEVYVTGECLAGGYCGELGEVDAFPSVDGKRYFRSGDLAIWRDAKNHEQTLYVLGRSGQMVKVRGQRVELSSVEAALCSRELAESLPNQTQTTQTVVFTESACWLSDSDQGPELVAFGVLAPGLRQSHELMSLVREELAKLLPSAAVPAVIIPVYSLPKLASGKVDRRALSTLSRSEAFPRIQSREEVSQMETVLREIWQSCLSPQSVSLAHAVPDGQSFFTAGGDSAGLMKLASRLRQVCLEDAPDFDDVVAAASISFSALLQLLSSSDRTSKRRRVADREDTDGSGSILPRQAEWSERSASRDCMCHTRGGSCFAPASVFSRTLQGVRPLWRGDLQQCVDAPPLVVLAPAGDRTEPKAWLLVGSHSKQLCCFEAETGVEHWRMTLSDRIEGGCACSCTADRFQAYAVCYDGKMHCIAIESGHLLWSSSIALPADENTEIKSAPVVHDDLGIVVAGTHGGVAAALSLDGHLLWRLQLPGAIFAAPLLAPSSGEMYICLTRGQAVFKFCCNSPTSDLTSTPVQLWSLRMASPIFAAVFVDALASLLVVEVEGRLQMLAEQAEQDPQDPQGRRARARTPRRAWSRALDGQAFAAPCLRKDQQWAFIGTHGGSVSAIRLTDGNVMWRCEVGDVVYGSPFVVNCSEGHSGPAEQLEIEDSLLFVATRCGALCVLDAAHGTHITRTQLEGEVFSSPVAWCTRATTRDAQHEEAAPVLHVGIGCRDNHVYCFVLA